MLIDIDCPLCGSNHSEPWAEERSFKTVRCCQCRLLYVTPRPADADIDAAVQIGVHADGLNVIGMRVKSKVGHYRRLIGPMFADFRGKSFSWMDVGAGFGEVVEAVKKTWPDANAFGLEPMTAKAATARARGLDVRNEYLDEGRYEVDLISANDVFSHVPDFRDFLGKVKANLKPRGSILLVTGNLADLEHRTQFPGILGLPDHLVFAGESQLARFLHEAGFVVRSIRRERFDTVGQSLKIVAKKLLGRPVHLTLPYASAYRSLAIRADLV